MSAQDARGGSCRERSLGRSESECRSFLAAVVAGAGAPWDELNHLKSRVQARCPRDSSSVERGNTRAPCPAGAGKWPAAAGRRFCPAGLGPAGRPNPVSLGASGWLASGRVETRLAGWLGSCLRCSGRVRPPQPRGGSGVQEQKSEFKFLGCRGAARLSARARAALSARDCAPLRIRGCSLSHPIARAGSRRFNLKGICPYLKMLGRYDGCVDPLPAQTPWRVNSRDFSLRRFAPRSARGRAPPRRRAAHGHDTASPRRGQTSRRSSAGRAGLPLAGSVDWMSKMRASDVVGCRFVPQGSPTAGAPTVFVCGSRTATGPNSTPRSTDM